MKTGLYCALAAASLFAATQGLAADFSSLDANRDGKLSREEFSKYFDVVDSDGNGGIDPGEYSSLADSASDRARFGSQGSSEPSGEISPGSSMDIGSTLGSASGTESKGSGDLTLDDSD